MEVDGRLSECSGWPKVCTLDPSLLPVQLESWFWQKQIWARLTLKNLVRYPRSPPHCDNGVSSFGWVSELRLFVAAQKRGWPRAKDIQGPRKRKLPLKWFWHEASQEIRPCPTAWVAWLSQLTGSTSKWKDSQWRYLHFLDLTIGLIDTNFTRMLTRWINWRYLTIVTIP